MKQSSGKRDALIGQLAQYSDCVRGSITSVCSTCHRARCLCRKRTPVREAYRLTYKDRQQKTRTVYVRQQQLPKVRTMIANYARVRRIIEQLVEANIELFKKEAMR